MHMKTCGHMKLYGSAWRSQEGSCQCRELVIGRHTVLWMYSVHCDGMIHQWILQWCCHCSLISWQINDLMVSPAVLLGTIKINGHSMLVGPPPTQCPVLDVSLHCDSVPSVSFILTSRSYVVVRYEHDLSFGYACWSWPVNPKVVVRCPCSIVWIRMLFRCSQSHTYTDYLDMPVRGFQEEMGDDSGRSESSEDEEEEEDLTDYGSEDDDVITPLRDRESWKSFFGGCLALLIFCGYVF